MSEDGDEDCSLKKRTTHHYLGTFLLGTCVGVVSLAYLITVPFLLPAMRKHCLPYIPATPNQISNVLKFLPHFKGPLLDIGSGDGRVLFALSRELPLQKCCGVELNYWLVTFSRLKAFHLGLGSNVKIYRKNLWKFDLSSYSTLIVFGTKEMMQDLEAKMLKECYSGTIIVACRFPLANLKPFKVIEQGIDSTWIYSI